MNCHSQIFANSPFLEEVRESFRTNRSIQWTRVHDLPDFVYFNHSIHVHKGVGCDLGPVCKQPHGRVHVVVIVPVAAVLRSGANRPTTRP